MNLVTSALYYIRSDKDTHFSGALAQNAGELESLSFPAELNAMNVRELVIESITIIFEQAALEWDVYLWSKAAATTASNVDTDNFLAYVNFASTGGKQIAGTGSFYYSAFDLNLPYKDQDVNAITAGSKLHVTLVNRSATAKNAGATGEVVVLFGVRPVTK